MSLVTRDPEQFTLEEGDEVWQIMRCPEDLGTLLAAVVAHVDVVAGEVGPVDSPHLSVECQTCGNPGVHDVGLLHWVGGHGVGVDGSRPGRLVVLAVISSHKHQAGRGVQPDLGDGDQGGGEGQAQPGPGADSQVGRAGVREVNIPSQPVHGYLVRSLQALQPDLIISGLRLVATNNTPGLRGPVELPSEGVEVVVPDLNLLAGHLQLGPHQRVPAQCESLHLPTQDVQEPGGFSLGSTVVMLLGEARLTATLV